MVDSAMVWDLSQLVDSTDSTMIKKNLDSFVAEARKIREKYHGKIANLDPREVLKLLESRDALVLKFEGTAKYCYLMYAANSTDETAKQLNGAVRRTWMIVGQTLGNASERLVIYTDICDGS